MTEPARKILCHQGVLSVFRCEPAHPDDPEFFAVGSIGIAGDAPAGEPGFSLDCVTLARYRSKTSVDTMERYPWSVQRSDACEKAREFWFHSRVPRSRNPDGSVVAPEFTRSAMSYRELQALLPSGTRFSARATLPFGSGYDLPAVIKVDPKNKASPVWDLESIRVCPHSQDARVFSVSHTFLSSLSR